MFYERHFASVLAFFRRRAPGPEEAFDLAAETFAAALPRCLAFSRTRAASGLAVRDRTSQVERGAAQQSYQDEARRVRLRWSRSSSMTPATEILETIATAPAIELLQTLTAEQREAIEAHHIEERGYAQIAAELRFSESVIRKRVSRGLSALHAQLQKERTRE